MPGRALRPLIESPHHPLAFPTLRLVPGDRAGVGILILLIVTARAAPGAQDQQGGCKEYGSGFHYRAIKSL